MGLSAAGQMAEASATDAAIDRNNQAKIRKWHRDVDQYNNEAMLDNVQYLNDVQEQDRDQDLTYQAMMTQWSDQDFQLKKLFAQKDFEIEDAIVKMHENSYAGTQTGATAARLAGKSAMEMGRKKSRILHEKMMAVDEANIGKEKTYRAAKNDAHKLFMDVAFAPVHGPAPARPELDAKPSKAGLILGLAQTGIQGAADLGAFKAKKVTK